MPRRCFVRFGQKMSKLQNFETFIGLVCINHLDLKLHTCIQHSIKVCLVIVLIDLTVTLKECQNYRNIYCTCLCLPSCPDDISATIDRTDMKLHTCNNPSMKVCLVVVLINFTKKCQNYRT